MTEGLRLAPVTAVVGLAGLLASAGPGVAPQAIDRPEPHPRLRLFPDTPAVASALGADESAELRVIFTPKSWECTVSDDVAARVVRRFEERFDDVAAWTLRPSGASRSDAAPSPVAGRVIPVPMWALRKEAELTPLPRIEVWTRGGRLLLLRSLGSFQDDDLYEELVWTRSLLASGGPDA